MSVHHPSIDTKRVTADWRADKQGGLPLFAAPPRNRYCRRILGTMAGGGEPGKLKTEGGDSM